MIEMQIPIKFEHFNGVEGTYPSVNKHGGLVTWEEDQTKEITVQTIKSPLALALKTPITFKNQTPTEIGEGVHIECDTWQDDRVILYGQHNEILASYKVGFMQYYTLQKCPLLNYANTHNKTKTLQFFVNCLSQNKDANGFNCQKTFENLNDIKQGIPLEHTCRQCPMLKIDKRKTKSE